MLPMLLIMHRQESEPGAIGQWLRLRGVPWDVRRPRFGDTLPATLEGHSGAILFGGPMSANDPDTYIKTEIDWLKVPLREEKPFLGVCLGAQMLSKHLGGTVYCRDDGRVEVGYEALTPNRAGFELGPWPSHVYHWHGEGFTLPGGAEILAGSQTFENQAFRVGKNAFGFQFHPEVTLAIIRRWTTLAARRLNQPGAQAPAEHVRGHEKYGAEFRSWTFGFLDRWFLGKL